MPLISQAPKRTLRRDGCGRETQQEAQQLETNGQSAQRPIGILFDSVVIVHFAATVHLTSPHVFQVSSPKSTEQSVGTKAQLEAKGRLFQLKTPVSEVS